MKERLRVLLAFRGQATFANSAPCLVYHEQTFQHHFERFFDWIGLNLAILRLRAHPFESLNGGFDCSLLLKGGTETSGMDRFFCSRARRSERRLEVSLLGVVATESRRTTVLGATQTHAGLSVPVTVAATSHIRMGFYLEQVVDVLRRLDRKGGIVGLKPPEVVYWVSDGNYARKKIFDGLEAEGHHLITRLRSDTRLRPAHRSPQRTGREQKRQYEAQVQLD